MAESESGQEKTEEPTAKRLKESRDKGEIARSKELDTLAVVLAAAIALLMFGPAMVRGMTELMVFNFTIDRESLYATDSMGLHLLASARKRLDILTPIFFILLVAALVGPLLL